MTQSEQQETPDLLPDISLEYPTPDRFFSPQFRNISGLSYFRFNQHCRLVSVSIGLRGRCKPYHRSVKLNSSQRRKTIQDHYENHLLLNEVKHLFKSTFGDNGSDFVTGDYLELPFALSFPKDRLTKIPSSVKKFGILTDNSGFVDVHYEVYLHVKYHTDEYLLTKEFTIPIKFKDAIPLSVPETTKNYVHYQSIVYKDKLKQLMPHPITGELVPYNTIPSSMNSANSSSSSSSSSSKSKWKKKLSASKKLPKYDDPQRDVQLRLIVEIPKLLNLTQSLHQIPIQFEVHNITFTDFKFRGDSTKLGCFIITQLEINLISELTIDLKKARSSTTTTPTPEQSFKKKMIIKTPIFNSDESFNYQFDVADFQYEKNHDSYIYQTTLGVLTTLSNNNNGDAITEQQQPPSLRSILNKPIMGAVKLGDYLTNTNSLHVKFTISNNQTRQNKSQSSEFKFFRNVLCFHHFTNVPEDPTINSHQVLAQTNEERVIIVRNQDGTTTTIDPTTVVNGADGVAGQGTLPDYELVDNGGPDGTGGYLPTYDEIDQYNYEPVSAANIHNITNDNDNDNLIASNHHPNRTSAVSTSAISVSQRSSPSISNLSNRSGNSNSSSLNRPSITTTANGYTTTSMPTYTTTGTGLGYTISNGTGYTSVNINRSILSDNSNYSYLGHGGNRGSTVSAGAGSVRNGSIISSGAIGVDEVEEYY